MLGPQLGEGADDVGAAVLGQRPVRETLPWLTEGVMDRLCG